MREVILLRHAHASTAAAAQGDHDRALSPIGQQEALAAGRWLAEHGLHPDRVLCSPSLRTRQTLAGVQDALGDLDVRFEPAIYEATPGTLAALLDAQNDAERLLLVGHNPGLEQLLALLNSGQSGDHRGMPPGAIAVLHVSPEAAIEPGAASLHAFWWP